jgi:hypothetical protein
MAKRLRSVSVGLTLALVIGAGVAQDEPARRVLLLTNEITYVGVITEEPDGWRVKNQTGELVIPVQQVLRVCDNLAEAYGVMKSRANLRDAHERLRLARWCLKQQLIDEARGDATAALQLAPRFVEAQRFLTALPDSSNTGPDSGDAQRSENRSAFAAGDRQDEPRRPAPPKPVTEHTYSQETLQTFTRKVQPILFNSCGTGQCHGGSSKQNGFELQRPFGSGGIPAQMTRQNLLHTLGLLDKDDPAGSLLLRKALEPHGKSSRPPLNGKDAAAYKSLESWAFSASGVKKTEEKPVLADEAPKSEPMEEEKGSGFAGVKTKNTLPMGGAIAPTVPLRPRVTIGPDGRPMIEQPAGPALPRTPGEPGTAAGFKKPAGTAVFQGSEVVGTSAPKDETSPAKLSNPPRKPTADPAKPIDPFDPAQFNRQHHPEKDGTDR